MLMNIHQLQERKIVHIELSEQQEILARYQRAETFECCGRNLKKVVFNTTVLPHWIGNSDCFWYLREHQEGKEFRLVDSTDKSNTAVFDHVALAAALGRQIGDANLRAEQLPFDHVNIKLSPREVTFSAFEKHWLYKASTQECIEQSAPLSERYVKSPDGTKAVFLRQYNLWLRDLASGEEKPLTRDGERYYCYATTPATYGRQENVTLEALWSPDSKRILTLIKDSRKVKLGPALVRHVPPVEVGLRPDIIDSERRVALPGDKHVEENRFLSIDIATGEQKDADYRACPVFFQHYTGFFTGGRGWWSPDSRRAYFIDHERGGKVGRLLEFDTDTGKARIIIEDHSESRVKFGTIAHFDVMLRPLPDGNEVVWFSERSGWPHLYLYDLDSGQLKTTITQGEWMVRNILHIDADRRELIITTAGRVAGRNPYYRDICRVNIDTAELTPLVSSDDEYFTADPGSRGSVNIHGVSPSGNYLVTTRSRVDTVPESVLLDRQGEKVMSLETADVSGLPQGWQWPEPVMVKAADGETPIYASVFRPSDFSPDKSYPVLDFSSFVTHGPVGSFSNNYLFGWAYFTAAAYAELGFIVVCIMTRGTDLRGVEFENQKDAVLGYCFHQDDSIAAIKQLADQYPYMDIDRVGLGGSYRNPPNALSGILRYPDFYKVAVSENAASDSRLLSEHVVEYFKAGNEWNEDQRDYHLEGYASQLKGKLLLIHGMIDNTVPVATAFRMIEALQKNNKDFDLLILPNLGHGGSNYAIRRTWDYLVRHLQGIEPPSSFCLDERLDWEDTTQYLFEDIVGI